MLIKIISIAVMLGGLSYVLYRLVAYYGTTQGSTWDRLLATGRHSHVVVWNFLGIIGASAYGLLPDVMSLVGMPETTDFLKAHVSPEVFGMLTVGFAMIGILLRWHRATDLPQDPK